MLEIPRKSAVDDQSSAEFRRAGKLIFGYLRRTASQTGMAAPTGLAIHRVKAPAFKARGDFLDGGPSANGLAQGRPGAFFAAVRSLEFFASGGQMLEIVAAARVAIAIAVAFLPGIARGEWNVHDDRASQADAARPAIAAPPLPPPTRLAPPAPLVAPAKSGWRDPGALCPEKRGPFGMTQTDAKHALEALCGDLPDAFTRAQLRMRIGLCRRKGRRSRRRGPPILK